MNSAQQTWQGITSQEWRFVETIILGVLIVTSLPYLYGYLSSPPDKVYMGLMLDVPDHGQYLSWWRGFQRSFLISNRLTPEPNDPVFFNLLWWALGQVSQWTGLGYAPVYQAFRWIAGGSFLWAAYRLIGRLIPEVSQRRLAFLLVTFSSGLGWVLVLLKYTLTSGELLFPLDLYVAEGNSFLCILGYPHFALAAAFIALTFEFIWRGWRQQRMRYMAVAGAVALLLGWMHAYDLLLIYAITGAFGALLWLQKRTFPWQLLWGGVIVSVLSCSGAVYSLWLTTTDPLWEEVLVQFANAGVYTPSLPHLLILFGFPLLFAAATEAGLIWKGNWGEEDLFITAWFAMGLLLAYIPTDFQIHMLNSWQIPMMLLVTKGLYRFVLSGSANGVLSRSNGWKRWWSLALLVAVLPTNLYLLSWRFVELARHDYPYYLYQDEVAALAWLDERASADAVILSSLTIGQYLPALGDSTAFLAHWAQTVDFFDKRDRVAHFFSKTVSNDERLETVCSFGIDYVFYGPAERLVGDYDPTDTLWLHLTFSTPRVTIYHVERKICDQAVHRGTLYVED